MNYKHFKFNCILKIIVLSLTIFLFIYLISKTSLYASTFIVGVLIIVQVYRLIRYVDETNRILSRFLDSIKYSDFSQTFMIQAEGGSFAHLSKSMYEVISEFQKVRTEREEQYQYLHTVVRHVGIGLIAFDSNGNIDFINLAAKRLLRVNQLVNINSLLSISDELVTELKSIGSDQKALVKVNIDDEQLQLSIHGAKFKLGQRPVTLVSIQNIESELAEQEMEAWQKLIRVLTHEIMNSVTPIASLASTINDRINDLGKTDSEIDKDINAGSRKDINQAAATIEKRSYGLLSFINAYRDLTRIPKPKFQMFKAKELCERIRVLMENQLNESGIKFTIEINPADLQLIADKELIEQVLINLLLNAKHASMATRNPEIKLNIQYDSNSKPIISITDNGTGIDQSIKEKIFLPFYTTKRDGSGIGLSLSRQIMRLHSGKIVLQKSIKGNTTFALKF